MKTFDLQKAPVSETVQNRSRLWHYKDLAIDPDRQTVFRQGEEIQLTSMEYALLEVLLRKTGTVCSRNELLETVWGITTPVQTRTVDVYVSRLRRKLHLKQELRSVKRRGYFLENDLCHLALSSGQKR